MIRSLAFVLLLLAAAATASAQELTGTVRDSASGNPVSNAVVIIMNDARLGLARTTTSETGRYALHLDPAAASVRVLRLGYRAREIAVSSDIRAGGKLDVRMITIPALLEPVRVSAATNCEKRRDTEQALSLLEQARAGLLATIVARETKPASLKLLGFDRTFNEAGDRIVSQTVRIDSSGGHATSFMAAANAGKFVTEGFAHDSGDVRTYLGPDADVLLDQAFLSGYCVRLEKAGGDRPNQVGLGFAPADRRKGRIDVDGTLWIDTVAKALRDIEFRWVNFDRPRDMPEPHGQVSFREMVNGVVLIDRWIFNLYAARLDTVYAPGGTPTAHLTFYNRDTGGELARAVWSDGLMWKGHQGTLYAHLFDTYSKPVTRIVVRLTGTDYIASPDAKGNVEIDDLIPGTYKPEFILPGSAIGAVVIEAPNFFGVVRDSITRLDLLVPSESEFRQKACMLSRKAQWVTATVYRNNKPVPNAQWELGEDFGTPHELVSLHGISDAEGQFHFCHRPAEGVVIQIRFWDAAEPLKQYVAKVDGLEKQKTMRVDFP